MKYIKLFRTLAIALTLALLAAVLPTTPVLAASFIEAYPPTGEIGDDIDIFGYSFTVNFTVYLYFSDEVAVYQDNINDEVGDYKYLGATVVDSLGEIDTTVEIPSILANGVHSDEKVHSGTYYIYATYSTSTLIVAVRSFTVKATGEIILNPTEGTVGTEVKVSGTGFAGDKGVTISFDGVGRGTSQTNSAGSFTDATFTVPASYQGSHTVEAKDASNNSDTATFTTKQSMAVTPTSGVAGATVTVSGTGFAADEGVTISFNDVGVGTSQTNSVGSFVATFNVPTLGAGNYNMKAMDGSGNSVTVSFALGVAAASFSPLEGYVGDEVTVSGAGFIASQEISITFDGTEVKKVTSGADGSFSISFTVPALAAGDYRMRANDGINTKEDYFKIKILASASISPITSTASPGHVGTEVTVNGVGFVAARPVTITYDGTPVATATVNIDGTFSATFPAPASSGGPHSISATDLTNIKQVTFTMESEAPTTPQPLEPEMDIKAEAEIHFDWEDVTDPSNVTYTLQVANDANFTEDSIVLEKTRLTRSEHTITEAEKLEPVGKEAPYYWRVRAIDDASNEGQWSGTRSFYVAGLSLAPSLPQPLIYTLFSIGALLLGILGFWLGRKTAYY